MAFELLKGIIVPIVTPCDENDGIDRPALEAHFARLLDTDINGMFINGGTGDGGRLSVAERKETAAMMIPRLKAAGKAALVSVGETYQRAAVELTVHTAETGADAVASVPPRASWDEIVDYYKAIAAPGLPVVVYYIPSATGVTAGLGDLARILDIDGVCGIKMSDWNVFLLGQVKRRYPEKIVYSGYDEMLLYGLLNGADGSIGTWANLFAPLYARMWSLTREGRYCDAVGLQARFSEFLKTAWEFGVIDAFEELMRAKGCAGRCFRRPGTWNPGKVSPEALNVLFGQIDALEILVNSL